MEGREPQICDLASLSEGGQIRAPRKGREWTRLKPRREPLESPAADATPRVDSRQPYQTVWGTTLTP